MTSAEYDETGAFTEASRELILQRWQEFDEADLTPDQAEQRRLAAALRRIISSLVDSTAPTDRLRHAADELERLAAEFADYPQGSPYEGFAEAANAGGAVAFFDHSPLLGLANPLAPPVVVRVVEDRIDGRVTFGPAYEGPPGCVHGGYLAAVFDEVLGAAQSLGGRPGMTGTLTVRYRAPTPLHTPLRFDGELVRVEGRKLFTAGTCHAGDTLTCEAEAVFITIPPELAQALRDRRDA